MELPHNLGIEQVIIGSLLNNNNLYDHIADILRSDDFFEPIHQILYKEIITKLNNGLLADILTIMHTIQKAGIDTQYLIQLVEIPTPLSGLRQYAEILIDLSTRRSLMNIANELITQAGTTENVNDLVNLVETQLFTKHHKTIQQKTFKLYDGSKNAIHLIAEVIRHNKKLTGMTSGFSILNEMTGGFRPGELIILAARPSIGKTAFATNIAVHCAQDTEHGGPVLFISLEMPCDQICYRIISSLSGINLSEIIHAKIDNKNLQYCMKTIDRIKRLPLFIHDSSSLTPGTLKALIRQLKRKENINLVIIDYLQLMECGEKVERREQEVSKISRSLKLIAKELNIPILVLSQLSRDIEKRKEKGTSPKLSDLRDSGAIEQDADSILFLWRENDQDKTNIKLLVAKNRNGPLGTIQLIYKPTITTFEESYLVE